jgi:hypothetical protein
LDLAKSFKWSSAMKIFFIWFFYLLIYKIIQR